MAPLSEEHPGPLIRLLGLRNSTARGLASSVGQISVSDSQSVTQDTVKVSGRSVIRVKNSVLTPQDTLLSRPPPSVLQTPWDLIALRHCACAHALYNNNYQEA